MPEQNEWQSDSGDYRWHPEYARRVAAFQPYPTTRPVQPPYGGQAYDTRTECQKRADLEKRVAYLEAIVHKYINSNEGDL